MFEAKADVNKMKAELAVKNQDLAVSAKEAEALLKQISESTAIAEKEKQKVAVIVDAVRFWWLSCLLCSGCDGCGFWEGDANVPWLTA